MARDERELRYTKTHEWIAMEGEKAIIGITAFAVKELQELVFIDRNRSRSTPPAAGVMALPGAVSPRKATLRDLSCR